MATYSHFDQGLSGFIVLESSTFQAFLMKTKERLDTRAAEAEAEVPMIPNWSQLMIVSNRYHHYLYPVTISNYQLML